MHAPALHLEEVHTADGSLAVATVLFGVMGLLLVTFGQHDATQASVDEARLDQQGALAREIAQRAVDASLRQAQSEEARRRNKAAFTP